MNQEIIKTISEELEIRVHQIECSVIVIRRR